MRPATIAILLTALLCACERVPDSGAALPSITGPSSAPVQQAYLSVSDSAPHAGSTIVVAAIVSGRPGGAGIASYRVRLRYDTTSLALVDVVSQADVMQAVNPQPGELIIAGVSSKPSPELTLLIARFVARTATTSLGVQFVTDELNDAGYQSVLATTPTSPRPRQDRSLSRMLGTLRP